MWWGLLGGGPIPMEYHHSRDILAPTPFLEAPKDTHTPTCYGTDKVASLFVLDAHHGGLSWMFNVISLNKAIYICLKLNI